MLAKKLMAGIWEDEFVHSLRKWERAMSIELIAQLLTCGRVDDSENSGMMAWRYTCRYAVTMT